MTGSVALVLVSHSRKLAEGVVELAAQMAPGVPIIAAGGMADGGLGTSFDKVLDAVTEGLAAASGVVIMADLGSAILTVESVLEVLDDEAERIALADAPFVEGTVAAAVTAHGGGTVADVLASAEQAGGMFSGGAVEAAPVVAEALSQTQRTVVVRNSLGLHARPAAVLARLIAEFDATVTINGANGASVLELMKLGATGGQSLILAATGPAAAAALDAVVAAIEGGFGEV